MVLRAVSALPSVQLPSASTSPSTHFVRFCTFYTYIFAAIFVYISVHPRLPPSVDAQRCLYSTPTLIYSATASFSRPFSCTFLYTHAFLHLWTHSDASILHLHSSVDVQRSLQCYSRPVSYTFSYIHACIHLWNPSVDVQRFLQCYSYIFAAIFVYIYVHPHLHSSRPITCLVFKVAKSVATLHSSDRDFPLLHSLHSTSTFSEHFRIFDNAVNPQNFSLFHELPLQSSTLYHKHFRELLWVLNNVAVGEHSREIFYSAVCENFLKIFAQILSNI